MKIGLVCAEFNKRGGTSRYTAELAERLCEKHEVHLITKKYEHKIPGLIVHKYPAWRGPLAAQILADAIHATKCLNRIRKNLDIVHNAAANVVADVATAHSCHKAGIKVWNAVSRKECLYPKYLFYRIARQLSPANNAILALEKKSLLESKKIISVSEGLKREIIKYYDIPNEKVVVIPTGVNLKNFRPDKRRKLKIRQKYNISEDEIVLIFVGHEFKRKGLAHLIKALPFIEAKLIVIGKEYAGPYESLAKNLKVDNKIIFAGIVPRVEDYYAASDIFVFPTMYEAFPLVTLEAAASGLPILATKVNGTEELIQEGYNGFFIKRNPQNIAEKICMLIEDKKLLKKMGKNARKTAERYSWDKIAEKTMKVYEELVCGM